MASEAETPLPRENLISKAVEFLQHPKVQNSSLAHKKTFLTKKGLTTEEVELAVQRSGVSADPPTSVPASTIQTLPTIQPAAPGTLWSRVRDVTFVCVLIGGVSYGVYQVLKKYVLPIWLGSSKEQEELEALKKGITELEKNIQAVVDGMKTMQITVAQQEDNVRQMIQSAAYNRGSEAHQMIQDSNGLREIKSEITSLKGLLLSRNQFPKTPRTQPVIPSWQLASGTDPEDSVNASSTGVTAPSTGVTASSTGVTASSTGVIASSTGVTIAEVHTQGMDENSISSINNNHDTSEDKVNGIGSEVLTQEESTLCNGDTHEVIPSKKSSSFELVDQIEDTESNIDGKHVSFATGTADNGQSPTGS